MTTEKIVRVYFTDGNIKIYGVHNMLDLIERLPDILGAKCEEIYKIECKDDII